jgi:glycosyltransferase involved in cell wall biosynthesis
MQLTIAFVTGGLPFNGGTNTSLGGSETAMLCLARALAKRGHKVIVFCECDKPGQYDGVDYHHAKNFMQYSAVCNYDVLVASRWLEYLAAPTRTALRILWIHDTINGKERFISNLWQTDAIFALSDFHIKNYMDEFAEIPELRQHFWKTSNGVDFDVVEANRVEKVPGKLIYTSRPERGMHFLLGEVFPRLIEKRPDLKLFHAAYDLQGLNIPDHVKQVIEMSAELSKKFPGKIFNLGSLSKARLYQEISSSELMLYPTLFPEISCITAMEAAACGTPIVSTDDFALSETVSNGRTGVLVKGKPTDEEYIKQFVNKSLKFLNDKDSLKRMSIEGPSWVKERGYTWEQVAASWEKKFLTMLEDRLKNNRDGILKQFERESNLVLHNTFTGEFKEEISSLSGFQRELPEEDIVDVYGSSLKKYEKLMLMLREEVGKPKAVLDLYSGDASFGMFAKRILPEAEVVSVNQNSIINQRLTIHKDKCKLDLNIVDAVPSGKKFDIVYVGNLDTSPSPHETLNNAGKLCSENGIVAFISAFGDKGAKISKEHKKLWNFDFQDLRLMLGHLNHFDVVMHEGGMSMGGNLYGDWLCAVKAPFECKPFDSMHRLLMTRPYRSLACCMIVKDEEDNLSKCLKSVRPIVDYLVITDTGSTDRTMAIAAEYADEVRNAPSIGPGSNEIGFAEARNISKNSVKQDWILWIDADEVLSNNDRLRRYLDSTIFDGFAIRQNHLMQDVPTNYDLPIRLLKNLPKHNFTGEIHEHCENTEKGPFDNPIQPALVLPDVDILHVGYLNERLRRKKSSNRNMALLQRDVEKCGKKGRMLTWILSQRDFLNQILWSANEHKGRIQENSKEHKLAEGVIDLHLKHFSDSKNKYHVLSMGLYQTALTILGKNGLCYKNGKYPPFEVAFSLAGAVGGMEKNRENLKPKTMWFLDDEQYMKHVKNQSIELVLRMGIVPPNKYKHESQSLPPALYGNPGSDVNKLLALGTNIMPEKVGQV